jgi:hypothetical protein
MSIHRWWLALIAALLTPWVGPHTDRYLPVGWVLSRAYVEAPDAAFWVIGGVLLALCYVAWVALLSGFAWVLHRRRNRGSPNGCA